MSLQLNLTNQRTWFRCLIVAAGLLVYHNSLSGPFVFDDRRCILENPNLRHLWPLQMALSTPPELHPLVHRPLVCLSLAINYFLSGFHVWGYHAFNLALHLLVALALFGLVRHTLQTPRLQGRHRDRADQLALVTCLIWVVHPLNTQTVDVVIRRSESLMGLFYLLTLYGLVRSSESPHRSLWKTVSVASCALGMLSKEIMVSAPLMGFLYDWLFLAGSFRGVLRQRWRLHLCLAGTWLILAFLFLTGPPLHEIGLHFPKLTFWDNLKTQCNVLIHYLRLALWPHPLVLDYAWPIARTLPDFLPAAVLLVALLAATGLAFRWRPEIGFLGIWPFLILAPTSLVPMPLEIIVEHRMYLPLTGIVAGLVVGGYEVLRKGRIATLVVIGILGLFGFMTVERNRDYQTEVSIWKDTVKKRPNNGTAFYNLGVVFLREQRWEEAIQAFTQALQLMPSDPMSDYNLRYAMKKAREKLEKP